MCIQTYCLLEKDGIVEKKKGSRDMLKRKITKTLREWKESGAKQALNIIGARQIGKSTAVRAFGKENYAAFIELNFIEQPDAVNVFKGRNGAEEILENLTAFTRQSIVPGDTLILLDEIQECPEARTAIKFLVEDGRAHYIETGSLLGVKVQDIHSYPVGFERIVHMYPMDFEEFLWAVGMPEETISLLKNCYEKLIPVADVIHQSLLRQFYLWMAVGGMPEVVSTFVQTHDMARVASLQSDILRMYELDITKYAERSQRVRILDIFHAIPSQLDDKNRRFLFNSLQKGLRFRNLENSFLWLSEAGISLPCYNTSAPLSPLRLNEKRSLFKLYFCDTGLLCTMAGYPTAYSVMNGDIHVNLGAILENAFAQSLASKQNGADLFYFDNKKIELDFLVQNGNKCDVLEIKSGNSWTSHTSLNNALNTPDWDIDKAIVFCKGNVEKKNNIVYLPLYMILFYEPTTVKNASNTIPADMDLDLFSPENFKALQAQMSASEQDET